MTTAVFPGSFDPFTIGHVHLVERAALLFDVVIVALGSNQDKKYMFTEPQRLEFISRSVSHIDNVQVQAYSGLTMNFCESVNATCIVRGIRNHSDLDYEESVARANHELSGIETVYLHSRGPLGFVASSIVRDLIKHNGDFKKLLSPKIQSLI